MARRLTGKIVVVAGDTTGRVVSQRPCRAGSVGKGQGRNVSTTLRQPNVEFKLGFLEFSSVN
jgi:hypothetical protein